jgi:GNAT superfamily N-acetyltransferase
VTRSIERQEGSPADDDSIVIRPCERHEVDALEDHIPSPGRSRLHAIRFAEQRSGESSYLVSWLSGRPVGHLNLRWYGSRSPTVAVRLDRCPEINALGVWPPDLRNKGIGSALVNEAERLAYERGYPRICLGVGIDNFSARRLYERLGYGYWSHGTIEGSWSYEDHDGRTMIQREEIIYMSKRLRRRAG